MTAVQHLNVSAVDGFYATGRNITFSASISDVFSNATIVYLWSIDSSNVTLRTQTPTIDVMWHTCGQHFVEVTVIASILYEKVLLVNRTTAYLQYFQVQGKRRKCVHIKYWYFLFIQLSVHNIMCSFNVHSKFPSIYTELVKYHIIKLN